MEWLTENKIPVGKATESVVDWLIANGSAFFDALENGLSVIVEAILAVLQFPPPLIGVAIITVLSFLLHRSIIFTIAMALGLLFIVNQGYWEETTETLTLVLSSAFLCMVIGVPIGIYLAHHPRAFAIARPILDLMQTLPTFVYLIPAIIFFGIGMVPGLVATVIFVIPAPIRLTQLGIAATPASLREAGTAFGASSW